MGAPAAARWRVVGAAFVTMAHSPGLHYCYGIFLVAFLDDGISTSRAALGGVGSLSVGCMLLGAYQTGRLERRYGAAPVVGAGAALAALGLALSAAATELWHLALTFGVLVGVGHSLAFPPCPVAVARAYEDSPHAATASGVATAGSGAGTMVFGALASALVRAIGWRATFLVLALSTAVFVGAAALQLRRPPGKADGPQTPEETGGGPEASARLRALCVVTFCFGFGWEVPFVHLVVFARDAGAGASGASAAVLFVGVGGSLGRVCVSALADRVGAGPTYSALLGLTAVADAVLPEVIASMAAVYAYAAVVGTTAGGVVALTTPMAKSCRPRSLPEASGAVFTSMAAGLVAGPILAGLVRDAAGSYAWGFRGAAACWAIACALSLRLPPPPPRAPFDPI